MKFCVFSPDLPYPPNRGGRADVWRRILGLRALGHRVMLVCLVEPAGHPLAPSAAELAAVDAVVAARFSFPMRRSPWRMVRQLALAWHTPWHAATRVPLGAERQRLQAMLDDFAPDVLWLDGPWFGRVVLDVLARGCRARLAYRSHNIEHQYLWRQAAVAMRLRDRLAWRMACWGLARFERRLMDRADVVFDISMDDLAFWQAQGVQSLHWLPPLPELAVADAAGRASAAAAPDVPGEVVFVGNLATPNNVRGVQFLLCEVLPLLRARRPGTSVSIVGSRPGADVRAWAAQAGAALHADVAQPMQHMLGAVVLVNPVMTGSGVQVKMLDMLMTDRPIVTTTQGTRGLPAEVAALLLVADTAPAFADAVCAVLAQAQANVDVAERARVRQQFSVAGLGAALQRLAPAAPARPLPVPPAGRRVMPAPLSVLVVHSSAELYGSDKSLLDFARLRPAHMALTVVLPEDGPLAPALRACDAEVVVGEVCKLQRAMVSPIGLWRFLLAAARSVRFMRRLHRQRRFQLVYSNTVACLGGALFARLFGLPHVWHVRELVAGSPAASLLFRKLVRWLSQRAICNSNETLAWIADGGQARAARYLAVWNGVDVATQVVDREAARRCLGAAPSEVLFVLVGRINAWKGQQLLVRAFAALVRQGGAGQAGVRLAIVGSAFAGQGHWEQQLQAAVAASGCADQIAVHPFCNDVDAVWAAADVVVVPSTDPEPFGRVAVEAMAFARPVIAAAHGGLVEIVQQGVTGLLVPPRDAPALTNAMATLAADPALRAAMGRAGLARQCAVFSAQGYASRVAAVLGEVAAERPVAA